MPQKSKYSAEKKIEIIDKYMKGIKTSGQIISEMMSVDIRYMAG